MMGELGFCWGAATVGGLRRVGSDSRVGREVSWCSVERYAGGIAQPRGEARRTRRIRVPSSSSRSLVRRHCRATLDVAGRPGIQDDDTVPAKKLLYVVRRASAGCELFTAADLRSRCFRQEDGDHAGFFQYRKAVLEWMYNSLQQDDSFCFIAVEASAPEDRRVIGTLDATVYNASPGETMPRSIYVSSIAVRPDRRRNGVATAMLREVDQLAMQLNMTSIFLHVEPWNRPAVKLYRNLDYNRYQGELCKWLRDLSKAENTLLYKNLAWVRN